MFNAERSPRSRRIRLALLLLFAFVAGLSIGARAFMNTQPRAWLNIASCGDRCYRANDVAGLLASAGIVNAPGWVPRVVRESDKFLVGPYPPGGRATPLGVFPKPGI